MTATTLAIADTLRLPIDYVTKVVAILAQRRKGKTYTGSVIAEEFVAAALPFVALDPTGAWWGLRAATATRPGLPVVIIGGQHGDLPLERQAGRFIADLVLDHPGYYVLDLSLLGTRSAEREFATAFADRLYRRKLQPGMDFPLHLFVDEADMFVPQDKETGDMAMLGAFQAIVRRGGLHGLGCTLISQRPALVNKSVLTQLDILILLRLIAGNDQDAVDKNYISRAGSKEQRLELMASMASLALGEAWVWEPGAEPPVYERVRIRERYTFNSSATPRPGEQRAEPKGLADVDLAAIKDAMEEAIERAKADDPAELRRRIRDLERQLADRPVEPTPVPVPFVPPAVFTAGERLKTGLAETLAAMDDLLSAVEAVDVAPPALPPPAPPRREVSDRRPAKPLPDKAPAPVVSRARDTGETRGMCRRERLILSVLAQHRQGRTHRQLAILTGYSGRASTIGAGVSTLRKQGFVDPAGSGVVRITDEGFDFIRDNVELPPHGPALRDYWRSKLGKRENLILDALVDAYPSSMDHESVCAATGYSPDASTVGAGMSILRGLELAEGWRASPEFMDAIR